MCQLGCGVVLQFEAAPRTCPSTLLSAVQELQLKQIW